MSVLKKTLIGCCALVFVTGAFAQLTRDPGNGRNGAGMTQVGSGGGVSAQACGEATTYVKTVPNLICVPGAVVDPFDNQTKMGFRPECITIDDLTVRDVLTLTGVEINCDGFTLIVQAVRVSKVTPYIKCTAFVNGPGAGENTNFDSGLRFATNANLDDPVCNLAFQIPVDEECLGCRCLLFSPPLTTYTVEVIYVRRDNATGRVGAPISAKVLYVVEVPDRDQIACNIEYFSTVAAGVTQKCKITQDVVEALLDCLAIPDDLSALFCFETVIALTSIDFSVLRDAKNGAGNYDARWITGYLIDSDEEPIGCLLIEMANAALWHP